MSRLNALKSLFSRNLPVRSVKRIGDARLRIAVAEVMEGRCLLTVTPTFATGANFLVNKGPISVVTADLNKDGNLDFLAADSQSGTVTIRRGRGDGTFRPAVTFSVGSNPTSVVATDFNHDNKLDFAVAVAGTNQVVVFLGAGDGATFTPSATLAAGDLSIDPYLNYGTGAKLVSGDFDGDTNLDLAVTNPAAKKVATFLGQGNGQFSSAVYTSPSGSNIVGIESADFNKDGKSDLAITGNYDLAILIATSAGQFSVAQSSANNGYLSDAHDIIAADLTGDGLLDLAWVNGDLDNVIIYKGAANGTFSPFSSMNTGADFGSDRGPGSLVAGDFNNDTFLDLAVANPTYGSRTVMMNDGTGLFPKSLMRETPVYPDTGEPYTQSPADTAFDIAVGDFNKDGKLDILTADQGSTVTLLLNTLGDPSVHPPVVESVNASPDPAPVNSGPVTISATVSEVNGSIKRVDFFLETNGTPGLQDNDQSIGEGTFANGVWSTTLGTNGLTAGTHTVYAIATDAFAATDDGSGAITLTSSTPTLAVNDVTQAEGNSGTTAFIFTVTRSGDTSVSSTVDYAAFGGNGGAVSWEATAGEDFAPTTGALTFNVGQTSRTFTVLVNGDTKVESDEMFYVSLGNATNAVITDGNGVGLITNDDTAAAAKPTAPSGLSAKADSGSQVTLQWVDNATNESSFEVQRSATFDFASATTFTVNSANATGYVDTTVSNSTYYYRVRAVNSAGGSAYSNSVKTKTLATGGTGGGGGSGQLAAPTGFTASAVTGGKVTLNWTDNATAETGYEIQVSTDFAFGSFVQDITVPTANLSTYTVTGLSKSTYYYFRVRAVTTPATLDSAFSNSIKLKTLST